jgi:hypothetical protein
MSFSGGSLPDGRRDRLGRLRWNGFGFVEPANMPTYEVAGAFVPGTCATNAENRNLNSNSSSIEFAIAKMIEFAGEP